MTHTEEGIGGKNVPLREGVGRKGALHWGREGRQESSGNSSVESFDGVEIQNQRSDRWYLKRGHYVIC